MPTPGSNDGTEVEGFMPTPWVNGVNKLECVLTPMANGVN